MESYFQQPVGQESDTEWNQVEEHTMEHIFVLQDIDTPPTHTITQSDLLKQPQSSKYPQQQTKQVTEQVEADIQRNIKYNNIRNPYSVETTIIMFQIFLALNLIFAVSPKCASKAAVALLPLVKRATSHPSIWIQKKKIVPKQKHWLGKLRYDKYPFAKRIRFLISKHCSSSKRKKKKKGVMDKTPPCTFDAWVHLWLYKPGKEYRT